LRFYTKNPGFVNPAEFQAEEQPLVEVVPAAAAATDLPIKMALIAPGQGEPFIGAVSGMVFLPPKRSKPRPMN
jgi:hypothetical protein